jgi:hypothetical protein
MRVCVFDSLTAFIIFSIGYHNIVTAAHKRKFGLTNFLMVLVRSTLMEILGQ